ncbi:hypothetical protein SDC9_116027 [bioreactor metagenome]|uniref:Uncharacterized protein n=1 Tax=bioreactor metagenome TaxID=1076179 RepID=A0A645C166_9ZZZZ
MAQKLREFGCNIITQGIGYYDENPVTLARIWGDITTVELSLLRDLRYMSQRIQIACNRLGPVCG